MNELAEIIRANRDCACEITYAVNLSIEDINICRVIAYADAEDGESTDGPFLRSYLSIVLQNAGAVAKFISVYDEGRSQQFAEAIELASVDVQRIPLAIPRGFDIAHDWCLPIGRHYLMWVRDTLLFMNVFPNLGRGDPFTYDSWIEAADLVPEMADEDIRLVFTSLGGELEKAWPEGAPLYSDLRQEIRKEAHRALSMPLSLPEVDKGVSYYDAAMHLEGGDASAAQALCDRWTKAKLFEKVQKIGKDPTHGNRKLAGWQEILKLVSERQGLSDSEKSGLKSYLQSKLRAPA